MTPKMLDLLDQYDEHLKTFGVEPRQVADRLAGSSEALAHARYMLSVLRSRATKENWPPHKVGMWLGFVQCLLFSFGGIGIMDLRKSTRHLFDANRG